MVRWVGLLVASGVSLAAAPVPAPVKTPHALDVPPVMVSLASTPEELARQNPLAFLQDCHNRSSTTVETYRAKLLKQERLGDQLHPPEVIEVLVREKPFAILMLWKQGERKVLGSAVQGSLFVAGENNGKMKVWRPKAFLPIVDAGTADSAARSSARYALHEGSITHALKRTLHNWRLAERKGTLQVKYLGQQAIPELNNKLCDVFQRICDPPEVDPFVLEEPAPNWQTQPSQATRTLTIMLDRETGLQLGAKLVRTDGELIGSYFFQLQEVNAKFPAGQFSVSAFQMKR